MLLKILCLSTTFNSEKSANTQESEQQDSVDQEIENLRLFLLKKIYQSLVLLELKQEK